MIDFPDSSAATSLRHLGCAHAHGRRLRRLALITATISWALSVASLAIWYGSPGTQSTWVTMHPTSALAFFTVATALWLIAGAVDSPHVQRRRRAGIAFAVVASLIAIGGLIVHGMTFDFNFGELLFQERRSSLLGADSGVPPQNILGMLLISSAVLLTSVRHVSNRVIVSLVMPVLFVTVVSAAAIVYAVPGVHDLSGPTALSFPITACFATLCLGTLAARGAQSPLAPTLDETAGGAVLRRMLPWIIVTPVILGWLCIKGQTAGLYGHEFGTAVFVAAVIAVMAPILWIGATTLRATDIARRHATTELAEREHRFRALLEQSADGVATMSADGVFLYHSRAARTVLGVDPEQLVGTKFLDWLHPDDRQGAAAHFADLVHKPGVSTDCEFRFRHGDGSWHWIAARRTNLLHDPDIGAIVSNYRDVTVQRESQQALRVSEERFREMAEHIKEAFFVTDATTRNPLYVSPNWAVIWGRPLAEAYSPSRWIDAVHPEDHAGVEQAFRRTIEGEVTDHVFRIIRPDGTVRWVRGRAYPVRDSGGQVIRIVGVSSDVTELREAEERFTQAQKMEAVGRLAGGVAHDFNNLLTVIIAETDMMLDPDGPDRRDVELLKQVRGAAESAVVLTRQLLAFSRRELIEPTVFSIDDAVTQTSKMLRRLIGEDIRLTVKLSSAGASVRMDRGQLDQVLTNLAVNSRDAMPQGGSLTLATDTMTITPAFAKEHPGLQPGIAVVVTLTDTGNGMSPEVCARAFEPFFTTKSHGKGTGLGLATCHGIVTQSGGYIELTSTEGVGTTIRILLPLVQANDADGTGGAVAIPRGSECILLVEDDTNVRRVGARMLRAQGYSVLEARDAMEARRILMRAPESIDMLLTDVVMPGMGGRELADLVRQMLPDIKVLFATGYTDDMILQHQVLEHDVVLLHKPYTAATLAIKVRETLDAAVAA